MVTIWSIFLKSKFTTAVYICTGGGGRRALNFLMVLMAVVVEQKKSVAVERVAFESFITFSKYLLLILFVFFSECGYIGLSALTV